MTSNRPRLLVLSFSRISGDARVLKQVDYFSSHFDVVTCGFGPLPEHATEHIALSEGEAKWVVLLRAALIRLRLYRLAYWSTPAVREGRRKLHRRAFDLVLANDLDTAGLAVSVVRPEKVHLDLHEYWPGRQDQNLAWVKLRKPFYEWQLRTYASRVNSTTTVSDTIARRYRDEFGLPSGVVTNASPFQDLLPQPISAPLKLVHSGACQPSRRIENMIKAVIASQNDVTFDLLLMGEGTEYHQSLVALAEKTAGKVRVLPPVPHGDLVRTLNAYDVGVHLLPPTNTNNALALPNKFFDYVQARLALVIGPTASMAELLGKYNLGVVTDDFTVESLTRALDALDPVSVRACKEHSNAAAKELSSERENAGWARAIREMTPASGGLK